MKNIGVISYHKIPELYSVILHSKRRYVKKCTVIAQPHNQLQKQTVLNSTTAWTIILETTSRTILKGASCPII